MMSFSMSNLWSEITEKHGKQPTSQHLGIILVLLCLVGGGLVGYFKSISASKLKSIIQNFGVQLHKVARTAMEIERKIFHLTGLGVPLLYQFLLSSYGWTQSDFSIFCWLATSGIWIADLIRISVPSSNNYFPFTVLNKIMREHERNQLSGTCYFSLGCTVAITLFPPAVATTSIIWLVLGDMSAALIGVSFGRDIVVVKMGRGGKKSMEGSVAMFVVCVVIGMIAFSGRYLNEYPVFLGALVATLVELYEPFLINDNLSIPIISSLALQWGLSRIERC